MLQQIAERVKISKLFVEAHIADIHFGVTKALEQYKILKEQFLDVLDKMETLDIVSIDGDLFEHKFMANSDAVMYACYFVEALVNICRRKNATLIIIGGTFDHDADQLKLFYKYAAIDSGVDVRIVEEVRFEYIKGKKILIIPELYGKGKEYYEKFLYHSGLYNAVYMHGTYVNSIHGKNEPDLDAQREPVFCMEHFINCCGPIMSGHVHTPKCFNIHFHYLGTPLRYKFGEEEEKGFSILLHNIDTLEYYVHFQPIQSFRYDTINLDDMLQGDPRLIIEYINQLQASGIDHIRVQFTNNVEDSINIVKNYYRSSGTVKIDSDFKNEKVLREIKDLDKKYESYGYLHSPGEPENKLSEYINQCEGSVFITADELKELLQDL